DLSFFVAPSIFDCSDVGTTTTVFLTVTDEAFNTNVCYTEVLVRDLDPPAIACRATVNVALPASGTVTMTDAILVYAVDDNCDVTYTFSPETVGCADVGSPVDVIVAITDPGGNENACVSTVIVEDNQPPVIACNPSTSVHLAAGGTLAIDALAVLAAVDDNCDLNYVTTPAMVDCGDAGHTVPVTIEASDPGGNTTTCSGVLNVLDPKPSGCAIIAPEFIYCGASGIQISAQVNGGYGPFDYHWEITKGAADGWSIVAGQGTPNVIIDAGIKKVTLVLTVTDVCGKKVKCKYKTTCVEPAPLASAPLVPVNPSVAPVQQIPWTGQDAAVMIYPNPARDHLVLNLDASLVARLVIMNPAGNVVMDRSDLASRQLKTVDVSGLTPGIYVLVVQLQDSGTVVRRFVKAG
ncbi:MAG: T9SS type A sorting domain-containing protein, partial [Saprospiraceae bacterium]|nr:T9SS type A sorting domain-containing protein [Saprospiraceae bacterium]